MNEMQAIKAVLKGDKQAYRFIIDTYKNPIYNTILRMAKNPQTAQDLTQEVFMKAYEQLPKFKLEGSFKAWLYRLATNHCIDFFRKKSNQVIFEQFEDRVSSNELEPEVVLLKKESERRIERIVANLPTDERSIVLMRYVNELSYEEIGALLGLTKTEIGNKLFRAKQKMRKQGKEGAIDDELYKRG